LFRAAREGRLHATPPSQETGEVRNPVFSLQKFFIIVLSGKTGQPSTPAREGAEEKNETHTAS
jgi:hypothetical protein